MILKCPTCESKISLERINEKDFTDCPGCKRLGRFEVYPALFRELVATKLDMPVVVAGESTCFYHEDKKASVPCSNCGRFICKLCDIDFDGQHLCPGCFDHTSQKDDNANLKKESLQYDEVALALAFFPIIIWPLTFVTAPMAIYMVFRYWNKSKSVLPRTKFRFILAFIFALGQIGMWGMIVLSMVTNNS